MRQGAPGDPASPVNNADDGNKIVVGHVAVNHDIRRNEADADKAAKLGARRAAFGDVAKRQIERVKVRLVAVGDKLARLRGKIADNLGGIGVRRVGDDDARPLFPERGTARGVTGPVFLERDEPRRVRTPPSPRQPKASPTPYRRARLSPFVVREFRNAVPSIN